MAPEPNACARQPQVDAHGADSVWPARSRTRHPSVGAGVSGGRVAPSADYKSTGLFCFMCVSERVPFLLARKAAEIHLGQPRGRVCAASDPASWSPRFRRQRKSARACARQNRVRNEFSIQQFGERSTGRAGACRMRSTHTSERSEARAQRRAHDRDSASRSASSVGQSGQDVLGFGHAGRVCTGSAWPSFGSSPQCRARHGLRLGRRGGAPVPGEELGPAAAACAGWRERFCTPPTADAERFPGAVQCSASAAGARFGLQLAAPAASARYRSCGAVRSSASAVACGRRHLLCGATPTRARERRASGVRCCRTPAARTGDLECAAAGSLGRIAFVQGAPAAAPG